MTDVQPEGSSGLRRSLYVVGVIGGLAAGIAALVAAIALAPRECSTFGGAKSQFTVVTVSLLIIGVLILFATVFLSCGPSTDRVVRTVLATMTALIPGLIALWILAATAPSCT